MERAEELERAARSARRRRRRDASHAASMRVERARARRLELLGLERPDDAEPDGRREDAAQRRRAGRPSARRAAPTPSVPKHRAEHRRVMRGPVLRVLGDRAATSSRSNTRRAAPASARPCARLARLATWLVERRVEERVELGEARSAPRTRGATNGSALRADCQSTSLDERLELARRRAEVQRGLEPRGVREAARRERRRRRAGGGATSVIASEQRVEARERDARGRGRARGARRRRRPRTTRGRSSSTGSASLSFMSRLADAAAAAHVD